MFYGLMEHECMKQLNEFVECLVDMCCALGQSR